MNLENKPEGMAYRKEPKLKALVKDIAVVLAILAAYHFVFVNDLRTMAKAIASGSAECDVRLGMNKNESTTAPCTLAPADRVVLKW